ncbi:hypothetical protein VTK73DRAFT_9381 [Phialemonium thermophilum]|uniref:Uncharacterized protein n=1 Tax=Phialemonium thermophilum TaxID=223376 RepID=A0ABR3W2L2_9PEZI
MGTKNMRSTPHHLPRTSFLQMCVSQQLGLPTPGPLNGTPLPKWSGIVVLCCTSLSSSRLKSLGFYVMPTRSGLELCSVDLPPIVTLPGISSAMMTSEAARFFCEQCRRSQGPPVLAHQVRARPYDLWLRRCFLWIAQSDRVVLPIADLACCTQMSRAACSNKTRFSLPLFLMGIDSGSCVA